MPYPRNFLRLTIEGTFGAVAAPEEIWRCTANFRYLSGDFGWTEDDKETFLGDIQPSVSTFHAGQINAGSSTFLASLAAADIGVDGKYTGAGSQPTTRYVYVGGVAGSGTPNKPMSTACCLTLRTTILRGRASRGRMFWPSLAAPIALPRMTLGQATQDGIAAQAKTMLDAWNAAARAMPIPAELSVQSSLGAGTAASVRRVEVGARLDAQERREKDVSEAYRGADLA